MLGVIEMTLSNMLKYVSYQMVVLEILLDF